MTLTLKDIADKLQDVKFKGTDSFMACCPAHDDDTASLSVGKGEKGIVMTCFAGCETKDVVQAMGIEMHDLFYANGNGATKPKKKASKRIVATYDYVDEDGVLLYQSVRYHPKSFKMRRPDLDGWNWSVASAFRSRQLRRVLYNLPAVKDAETVYLVEGEKDADRLNALGLVATTNIGGAGKWNAGYTEQLEGKHVVILPDHDEAGEKHAFDVGAAILADVASLRIVRLPDLPPKGDVHDWLELGGTVQELEKLARQAPEVVEIDKGNGPRKLSDIIANDLAAWGYNIRLNLLDDSLEVNGKRIDDIERSVLRTVARDNGYKAQGKGPTLGALDDVVAHIANENRYHPVRDYLSGLQWDGADHIGGLARYIEDEHTFVDGHAQLIVYNNGAQRTVFHAMIYRWLVGAVAKAFVVDGAVRPQNPVLVLVGGQGIGKSTFAQWLCPLPDRFASSPVRPDSKDDQLRLLNTFVWELGELGATMRRSDREALKWFLTLQDVSVRRPYARYPIRKPTLASFIGTLNPENGYLNDPTGNRRFVTCELRSIDHAYVDNIDVQQVWAQAVAAWQDDRFAYLCDPAEVDRISEINDDHRQDGAHAGMLERLFFIDSSRDDWWMSTGDIVHRLHSFGGVSITTALEHLVGSTLLGMGCKKVRRGSRGERKNGYTGIAERNVVS